MNPIEPTSLPVTPKDTDLLATEATIEDDDDFPDEETILRGLEAAIAARKTEVVSVCMPVSVIESLRKTAAERDTSIEALIRLYIGQGLRQELHGYELE